MVEGHGGNGFHGLYVYESVECCKVSQIIVFDQNLFALEANVSRSCSIVVRGISVFSLPAKVNFGVQVFSLRLH